MDKAKYFYRVLIFTREGEDVFVLDRFKENKKVALEPWLGVVVSLADGQHRLGELVEYLAGSYKGSPPADLERTIESVVDRLVESEVIRLSDEAVTLPSYLVVPLEEQDAEAAREEMVKDGYILQ
ncbi:MAG: hypothetical protein OEV42_07510 [Deltaproteobacteria bacterium]|nr:hypothetical protein [Deltaproteobacteria bacterium]